MAAVVELEVHAAFVDAAEDLDGPAAERETLAASRRAAPIS